MKKILLVVGLLFASPALAEGVLVKCLAGCPSKADPNALRAPGDVQVGDSFWLGPSLGLQLAARDSSTKTWEVGVALAFQYGIHWRPVWSPTPTFMSFNLGLAAGSASAFQGGGTFDITIAPTVTFFDLIAVGYGPRFKMATSSAGQDSVSGVFFVGLATSFGGP
jgi:hypothetical protein